MKTQIGTLRVGEVLDVLYVNGNKLKATVQWEDNHEIILRPVEHVLNLIAITKQQHRLFWLKPEVSWPEGTGPNSIPPDNDEQDNDEDDETTDQCKLVCAIWQVSFTNRIRNRRRDWNQEAL
jgi:hypothetical protein